MRQFLLLQLPSLTSTPDWFALAYTEATIELSYNSNNTFHKIGASLNLSLYTVRS